MQKKIKAVTITDCMLTSGEFISVAKFDTQVEFSQEMKEAAAANRKLRPHGMPLCPG